MYREIFVRTVSLIDLCIKLFSSASVLDKYWRIPCDDYLCADEFYLIDVVKS